MFYSIPLKAGVEYRHGVAGRVFLLDAIGAASGVTVKLERDGAADRIIRNRKKAFKCVVPFDSVSLTVDVDTYVDFFVSMDDVNIGMEDGASVTVANDEASPLPIMTPAGEPLEVLFAGVVAPVFGKLTNTDAEAVPVIPKIGTVFDVLQKKPTAIVNGAAVAVNDVSTAITAGNPARRGLRLRNAGANPVAIGGAGVAFATAVIIIQPGEVWNESEAPGAVWHGICEAGLNSTINVQSLS
jgi:hypothetical protein